MTSRRARIPVVFVPNIDSAAAPMTASPDPPSDRPFTIGSNIPWAPAVTPHYHYNHPAIHQPIIHSYSMLMWGLKTHGVKRMNLTFSTNHFKNYLLPSPVNNDNIKNLYCFKKLQQFHWQCNYETRIEFQKMSQSTKVQGQPLISHEKSRLVITWLL